MNDAKIEDKTGWTLRLRPSKGEFWALVALVPVSFGIGVLVNLARQSPLPWNYQPPAAKLGATAPAQDGVSSSIRIIDLNEARREVEGEGTLILDARPGLFHELGHLPGAVSLSRKEFDADYERVKSKLAAAQARGRPILVYCADMDCPDAGTVARQLQEKGLGNILLFAGGWAEWEAAGLPQEAGK